MKRILATILAMVMLCTIMGVTVFADPAYPVCSVREDFQDGTVDTNMFRIGSSYAVAGNYIETDSATGNKFTRYPGSAFWIGVADQSILEVSGNFIVEFEVNFDKCDITSQTTVGGLYFNNGSKAMLSGGTMFALKPATEDTKLGFYVSRDGHDKDTPIGYIAGAELKDGWNKIRYFFNKTERTVRLYINGEVAKDANGKTDFNFATNLNGNTLDDFYASKLTRVSLPVCAEARVDNVCVRQQIVAGGEDNDICKVVSASPSGDIPVNAESITYTFNHNIDADSVVKDEITINGTNDLVESVIASGKTVTINFAAALEANKTYNVNFGFAEDIYGCALPAATFNTPSLKIVSSSVPTVNADVSTLLTFEFNESLNPVDAEDLSFTPDFDIKWAEAKDNVLKILVNNNTTTSTDRYHLRKDILKYNTSYTLDFTNLESVSGLKLSTENAKYTFKTKFTNYVNRVGKTNPASPIIEENFDGFIKDNISSYIWGDSNAINQSVVNIDKHGENKYLNLTNIKRVSQESSKTFYTGGNGGSAYSINLYGDAAIEFDMKFDGVNIDFTFLSFGAEDTNLNASKRLIYSVPFENLLQFKYVEDGPDTVGVIFDDPENYDGNTVNDRKRANASLPIKEGQWNNIRVLFNRENTTIRLYVNGEVAKNAEGKTDFEFHFGQTTENYKAYPIANVAFGAPNIDGTNVYIDNITYRQLYATGPDGNYCEMTQGTELTPETKVLTYTFNHEIDAKSVFGVTINGSDEYIKSATASGNTVTVELTDTLPANDFYELDFGFTKDIYSCGLKSVKFNTEQYNLGFANFEGNKVDTTSWTLSGTNATMEGNALKISKTAEGTGNISSSSIFSYSGDVIAKTKVKLNSEGAVTFMNVSGLSDLVSVDNTGDNTVVKFGNYAAETVAYGEAITVTGTDSYIDIALSIDTDRDIYYGFVNGIKYGPYSFSAKALDAVTSYSFGLNTSAESMEVLVDDIFVGTKIFADKTENYGFYGEAGALSYNATFINRAPEAISFKLIVTTLSHSGARLESVDLVDILVPANGRYVFEAPYEVEEGETIKAIYLENIGTMEHFGEECLLTTAQR